MHFINSIKKLIPQSIKDNIKIINYKRKYKYKRSKIRNNKCVVLFLVSRTHIFSSVESVFTEANKNKEIDAYLIALPDRANDKKNMDNSNVIDFCKNIAGEKAIDCYDSNGSFIDLRNFNPDYIFLGIPYNEEYPDGFTFNELAEFSKLCFVPYGYGFLSGVVIETCFNLCLLSHISYLFAEGPVGNNYCRKKLYWFEKLEGQKVYSLGFPRFDFFSQTNVGFQAKQVKKIAYFPRWTTPESEANGHEPSSFMLFKDKILDFAEKSPDYEIIIRPHPLLLYRFCQSGLLTQDDLGRYRDRIQSIHNVTLDESKDYRDALISADIMVTDYSSTIAEFLLTGRPVIYFGSGSNISVEHKLLFKCLYYADSWEQVEETISTLSLGNDYKYNERMKEVQRILKPNTASAGELIVNKLMEDWIVKKKNGLEKTKI